MSGKWQNVWQRLWSKHSIQSFTQLCSRTGHLLPGHQGHEPQWINKHSSSFTNQQERNVRWNLRVSSSSCRWQTGQLTRSTTEKTAQPQRTWSVTRYLNVQTSLPFKGKNCLSIPLQIPSPSLSLPPEYSYQEPCYCFTQSWHLA